MQASKKQEKINIKTSIVCIILSIISVGMLASAYYMVTSGLFKLMEYDVSILLIPVSLGLFGTVIFFYSVAGMILKVLSKCHKLYYRNLNTSIL